MPVLGPLGVTLEVPGLDAGIEFYKDAGLECEVNNSTAKFRCKDHDFPAITLIGGKKRKKLHHITLRADGLDEIASQVASHQGEVIDAPEGSSPDGLWVKDPHGMVFNLLNIPKTPEPPANPPFEVNAPNRIMRKNKAAILPKSAYAAASPIKLGHILLFTPDVLKSVNFVTEALGMGLSDRSEDIVAFCCARKNSDHHVVAFAKSSGIGFHHTSFQMQDPDDVGRAGQALVEKAKRHDWGFGRHTAGSNFFHYIQDPWGSWFEYYADIDYIEDYSVWTPTNYAPEDSLYNWGPDLPEDFVHNYEFGEPYIQS